MILTDLPAPPSLFTGARLSLLQFSGTLMLCMLPAWHRARHDNRTIRGVNVWIKPLKFMAALALFAATTAVLMLAAIDSPSLKPIATLLIVTATFEAGYITFRAGRGEASHYNTRNASSTVLTVLMALGAIALTASQGWLAVTVMQQHPNWIASAPLAGVVIGLLLTFMLATLSGFMLGGRRAPPGSGSGLAVVGWHKAGDLRPAHFLGVHAQQCIPAFGLLANSLSPRAPLAVFAMLTCAYVSAFAVAIHIERRAVPT